MACRSHTIATSISRHCGARRSGAVNGWDPLKRSRWSSLFYGVSAMAMHTALHGCAANSRWASLLKQYDAMRDLHRARTAEQAKSLPDVVIPNVPDTWPYDTVHRRLRAEILKRVFTENAEHLKAHPDVLKRLQELDKEMQMPAMTPLRKLLPSNSASLAHPSLVMGGSRSRCSAGPATTTTGSPPDGALEKTKTLEQAELGTTTCTNGDKAEISPEEGAEGGRRYYPVEVELADIHFWNDVVLQREDIPADATWSLVPWIAAELYFYRRLAEVFSYFENGYDFFGKQKSAGLAESTGLLLGYAEALRHLRLHSSSSKRQAQRVGVGSAGEKTKSGENEPWLAGHGSAGEFKTTEDKEPENDVERDLRSALLTSLNGNEADLSLWPVDSKANAQYPSDTESPIKPEASPDDIPHILSDDRARFLADMLSKRQRHQAKQQEEEEMLQRRLQHKKSAEPSECRDEQGDECIRDGETKTTDMTSLEATTAYFFLDNAGSELLSDMWLACNLIEHAVVQKVVFFTKEYPIFVSDVLPRDIDYTLQWVRKQATPEHPDSMRALADLWDSYIKEGKWEVKSHVYFSMPYEYSDMPKDLYKELKEKAAFVISKGDANYRRLIGDRKWPYDTPFSVVAGYFPCPLLALRKLKANVAWGVMHYMHPQSTPAPSS